MPTSFDAILQRIKGDPLYRENVEWGEPRPGHPEGSIRAHIEELERNLAAIESELTAEAASKIRLLIHVHDLFKKNARDNAPITAPESHASLARMYLAQHTDDCDLLNMVQFHDEPYALYLKHKSKGAPNRARFEKLLSTINDWHLFLAFCAVDGTSAGKSRAHLHWFAGAIRSRVDAAPALPSFIEKIDRSPAS